MPRRRRSHLRKDYRPLVRAVETARTAFDIRKFTPADGQVRTEFKLAILQLACEMPPGTMEALSFTRAATTARDHLIERNDKAMPRERVIAAIDSATNVVKNLLRAIAGAAIEDLTTVCGGNQKLAKRKRKQALDALSTADLPVTPVEILRAPSRQAQLSHHRADPLALSRILALGIPITDLRTRAAKEAVAAGIISEEQVRANTIAMRVLRYNRERAIEGVSTSYAK